MSIRLSVEAKITKISAKEYNVNAINSIQDKYKPLRQKSKAPTFA